MNMFPQPPAMPEEPLPTGIIEIDIEDAGVIEIDIEPEPIPIEEYPSIPNLMDEESIFSEEDIRNIGTMAVKNYEMDKDTRSEWEQKNEKTIELANLTAKRENKPWDNAPDINYPLVATATIQFSSRIYGNLFKTDNIIKGKVIGRDPDGKKAAKVARRAKWMSYDIGYRDRMFKRDCDRLLRAHAITGTEYMKTFYDPIAGRVKSIFLPVDDVVINNNDTAPINEVQRITQVFRIYDNDVYEYMQAGIWAKVNLNGSDSEHDEDNYKSADESYGCDSDGKPQEFLEQCMLYDADGDGYKEPYVVTVHKDTQKVVRIFARWWGPESVSRTEDGEVIKIEPLNYYVEFTSAPSTDPTKRLGYGLGMFVMEHNILVNEALGAIYDAAYKQNSGGGGYDSGVSIDGESRGGNVEFKLGEYKPVKVPVGKSIQECFFEFRHTQPSQILYQLVMDFIRASREFTSVSDIMVGQTPAAGVPATTTMAVLEQALQVISTTEKRIHDAMSEVFKQRAMLDTMLVDDIIDEYMAVLDDTAASPDDFTDENYDFLPVSNPNDVADLMRVAKAKELAGIPGLNPTEVQKRMLESLNIEDIEPLMTTPGMQQVAQQILQMIGQLLQNPQQPPDQQQLTQQLMQLLQNVHPQQRDLRAEAEMEKAKADMGKVQVDNKLADIRAQELAMKERKTAEEMSKIKAETLRLLADAEKKAAEAESEEIGLQSKEYMDGLQSLYNMLNTIEQAEERQERLEMDRQRQQMEMQQAQQAQMQQQQPQPQQQGGMR